MTKVSIVGAAGTVGAAAGYNLALRDVVDELVFVDMTRKTRQSGRRPTPTTVSRTTRTRRSGRVTTRRPPARTWS